MTSNRGKQFIADTKYASTALITAISADHKRLSFLPKEIELASNAAKYWAARYEREEETEDFDDVQLQGAYVLAHSQQQQATHKADELALLQQELQDRYDSLNTLSGALLQIAKQGISVVYGNKDGPVGIRQIAGQALHAVIWEARNQSMHYEEGSLRAPVMAMFNALQASHGDTFSLTIHHRENLAYEVVKLLSWDNSEQYFNDLNDLL